MVIAGAGGLGIEILLVLLNDGFNGDIFFFDENLKTGSLIYDRFKVFTEIEQLKEHFNQGDKSFITGVGNPRIRKKLSEKILNVGGEFKSVISSRSSIFPFNKEIVGGIVQPGVGISHGVEIGISSAIHINSTIGHNSKIGDFVNIGPGANVIGPVSIGDYTYIGAQSVILSGLSIGKNVLVGAGSIVTKDIPDYGEWVNR